MFEASAHNACREHHSPSSCSHWRTSPWSNTCVGLWGRSCIACIYVSVSVELCFFVVFCLLFFFFLPLPPFQKDNKPIQVTHFVLSLSLLLSPLGTNSSSLASWSCHPLPLDGTSSQLDIALTLFKSRDEPGQSHQHQDGPRPL